jgi:hypothetical protein
MKLTPTKRNMLTRVASSPRRATFFNKASGFSLSQERVTELLAELVESCLLYEAESAFHITKLGRSHLDLGNVAATKVATRKYIPYEVGMCDPFNQPQRPNSDHSHLRSVGNLC